MPIGGKLLGTGVKAAAKELLPNSTATAVASGKKAALVSLAEDTAEKFAGQRFKAQSFRNRFKNAGLNKHEMDQVNEFLDQYNPLDSVEVSDFSDFIKKRKDLITAGDVRAKYSGVVTSKDDNSTYFETVFRKPLTQEEQSRNHYQTQDYYGHARGFRSDDGTTTVYDELQSDVHALGPPNEKLNTAMHYTDVNPEAQASAVAKFKELTGGAKNSVITSMAKTVYERAYAAGRFGHGDEIADIVNDNVWPLIYGSQGKAKEFQTKKKELKDLLRAVSVKYNEENVDEFLKGWQGSGLNNDAGRQKRTKLMKDYRAGLGLEFYNALGLDYSNPTEAKQLLDRLTKYADTIGWDEPSRLRRPETDGITSAIIGYGQDITPHKQLIEGLTELATDIRAQSDADRAAYRANKMSTLVKDPKYLTNIASQTLVENINDGRQIVKIRIADDPNLKRGQASKQDADGLTEIQKWYEGPVVNTYTKMADKIGASTHMSNDGYLVIDLSKIRQPDNIKKIATAAGVAGTALLATLPARAEDDLTPYTDEEIRVAGLGGVVADILKNTTSKAIEASTKRANTGSQFLKAATVSVLEDSLESLAHNGVNKMKKKSFLNRLSNQGVKKQELAILDDLLKGYKWDEQVPLEKVARFLSKRNDILKTQPVKQKYERVTTYPTYNDEKYFEQVHTKANPSGDQAWNHWNKKNYFSHARGYANDDVVTVQEIQTDLHNKGTPARVLNDDEMTKYNNSRQTINSYLGLQDIEQDEIISRYVSRFSEQAMHIKTNIFTKPQEANLKRLQDRFWPIWAAQNNKSAEYDTLIANTMEEMHEAGLRYADLTFELEDRTLPDSDSLKLMKTREAIAEEFATKYDTTMVDARKALYSFYQDDEAKRGRVAGIKERADFNSFNDAAEDFVNKTVGADPTAAEAKARFDSIIRSIAKYNTADIPQDEKWLTKTANQMLVNTLNNGQKKFKILVKHRPQELQTSKRVNKWYETHVDPTFRKAAKQFEGAKVSYSNEGHLVVDFSEVKRDAALEKKIAAMGIASTAAFLTSTVAAYPQQGDEQVQPKLTPEAIQQALDRGVPQAEIDLFMQQDAPAQPKLTPEAIQEALSKGVPQSEIDLFMAHGTQQPEQPEARQPNYDHLRRDGEVGERYDSPSAGPDTKGLLTGTSEYEEARILKARIENLDGTFLDNFVKPLIAVFTNDEEGQRKGAAISEALNQKVYGHLKEAGFEVDGEGILTWTDEEGQTRQNDLDSGVLADIAYAMRASPAEILAGGIAGAITKHPAIAGSAAGAASIIDRAYTAQILDEELNYKKMAQQAIEATGLDILGSFAIYGAGKGLLWTGKKVLEAAQHLKNIGRDGNSQGALDVLLKMTGYTPEQAEDVRRQYTRLHEPVMTTNRFGTIKRANANQETLLAMIHSAPGAEAIADSVQTSTAGISLAVSQRAKYIINQVDKIAPEEALTEVRYALQDLDVDASNYYEKTIKAASDTIDKTDYTFDGYRLAAYPAMEESRYHIVEAVGVETYQNGLARALELGKGGRSFSNLIELRQLVNRRKKKLAPDAAIAHKALKASINRIDSEISRAVNEYLGPENGKQWIKDFASAKKTYGDVQKLKTNVIYKALTRPGLTDENLTTRLKGFIDAVPLVRGGETPWAEISKRLTPDLKVKAKGAIVKLATEKFTIGHHSGNQAIHFPMLADELNRWGLKGANIEGYQSLVNEFADLFKNDLRLGTKVAGLNIAKFQSYLTDDPIVRLRFALASSVFNEAAVLFPTVKARETALTNQLANLIREPANFKAQTQLIARFPRDKQPKIKKQIQELMMLDAQIKARHTGPDTSVRLYKSGTTFAVPRTSGRLGPGYYMNERLSQSHGKGVVLRHTVKPEELATLEQISASLGKEVSVDQVRKEKGLTAKLKKAGYKGITVDGNVMLFDDPKAGVNK